MSDDKKGEGSLKLSGGDISFEVQLPRDANHSAMLVVRSLLQLGAVALSRVLKRVIT